jgi:hypothetical protein
MTHAEFAGSGKIHCRMQWRTVAREKDGCTIQVGRSSLSRRCGSDGPHRASKAHGSPQQASPDQYRLVIASFSFCFRKKKEPEPYRLGLGLKDSRYSLIALQVTAMQPG